MTLVNTVVERARRRMQHGSRGPVYTLAAAVLANATTITFVQSPEHIGYGSVLAIDYELYYVLSVDSGTKTATVLPGYYGTTSSAHAINSVIDVDPRFPRSDLIEHAEEELRSWGNRLFRVTTLDITLSKSERTYPLAVTGEVYFLLDARAEPEGAAVNAWSLSWVSDAWTHVDVRLLRQQATSFFSTGYALQLLRLPQRTGTLRVALAQPLDLSSFTFATDLEANVGIRSSWIDVLIYGIQMRAMSGSVMSRTDWRAAGHARAAEEAQTLDLIRAAGHARDMHQLRFSEEALELRAEWPYRRVA